MIHISNRESHAFEEGCIAEVRGEGLVDNPYDPDKAWVAAYEKIQEELKEK